MNQAQDASEQLGVSLTLDGETAPSSSLPPPRSAPPRKKVTTACSPCQRRKTKCSGDQPCTKCIEKRTQNECVIDDDADLRRKGVFNRRIEDLTRDSQLLDGIIKIVRTGDDTAAQHVCTLVRQHHDKFELLSLVEDFLQKKLGVESSITEKRSVSEPSIKSQRNISVSSQASRTSIRDILNDDSEPV